MSNSRAIIYMEYISVSKSNVVMRRGEKFNLWPTAIPRDATNQTIYCFSRNQNVATVTSDGIITAVGVGETTIRLYSRYPDDKIERIVNVKVENAAISLNITDLKCPEQRYTSLKYTVEPSTDLPVNIIWSSSDPDIAEVTASGQVRAKRKTGNAVITAKYDYLNSNAVATCNVQVNTQYDSRFVCDTIPNVMKRGKDYYVTATVENTGYQIWRNGGEEGAASHNCVCLATPWFQSVSNQFLDGKYTVPFENINVGCGERSTVYFKMKTNIEPGFYTLQFYVETLRGLVVGERMNRQIEVID